MRNEHVTSCDDERLRWLLAGQLPPETETAVTEHVAACSACRQKLESLAGDQAWWQEVQTCFRQNASASQSTAERVHSSHRSSGGETADELEYSVADFAVDFLEPCGQPETLGRLDDIEILEVIDRGGMGVVLKGFQRELGRYVAVKVMAPHLATSGSARQRFAREARAAAAIVHPHVMAIHSVNGQSRLPYLVMPFVACESLQRRLDRDGPLELAEILRIGRQVGAGLAAAHAQGLVHRDVKPANILLEKGVDRVLLTDFGLARAVDDASLTRSGLIAGTPQFMSPEQARGEAIDARSDLFSLGSVMYVLCTGRPPFRAETSYGILRQITDTVPRSIREINAAIPEWLCAIIAKLMAKQPAERFASADEVATLLEQCLAHLQQPAALPMPAGLRSEPTVVPQRRVSRRTTTWLAVLAVICVAVLGGNVLWNLRGPARQLPPEVPAPGPQPAAASSADDSDPTVEWETTADEIEALRRNIRPFKSRSQQIWDSTSSLEQE